MRLSGKLQGYIGYDFHHEEHEDHKGKHIILGLSFGVLRALVLWASLEPSA
jgi:hypothetical protein